MSQKDPTSVDWKIFPDSAIDFSEEWNLFFDRINRMMGIPADLAMGETKDVDSVSEPDHR